MLSTRKSILRARFHVKQRFGHDLHGNLYPVLTTNGLWTRTVSLSSLGYRYTLRLIHTVETLYGRMSESQIEQYLAVHISIVKYFGV
jgi:hypothetical protein